MIKYNPEKTVLTVLLLDVLSVLKLTIDSQLLMLERQQLSENLTQIS